MRGYGTMHLKVVESMSSSAAAAAGEHTDSDAATEASIGVGVPAAILLVVTALVLVATRCRYADGFFLRRRLAPTLCSLYAWDFGFYALVITTIVMTIVWGALLAEAVRPASVAVAVLALLPALGFVLAGAVLWSDRGWRLALVEEEKEKEKGGEAEAVKGPEGIAGTLHGIGKSIQRFSPELCFFCAAVLVLVYELAVVYAGQVSQSEEVSKTTVNETLVTNASTNATTWVNSSTTTTSTETDSDILGGYRYSYLTTSWVFLGVNALLCVLAVHFLTGIPDDEEEEDGDEGGAAAARTRLLHIARSPVRLLHAAVLSLSPSREGLRLPSDGFSRRGPAGATESAPPKKSGLPRRMRWALYLYVAAFAVLVVYSVTNWVLSDDPAALGSDLNRLEFDDQGAYLGFAASGVLLLADVLLFGAWLGGLIPSPGAAGMVVAVTRALVLAFGARWWLLGHAAVYFALGVFFANKTVARYMSVLESNIASKAAAADATQESTTHTSEESGASGAEDAAASPSGESKPTHIPLPLGGVFGPISRIGEEPVAVLTAPGSLLTVSTIAFAIWIGLFSLATDGVPGFPSAKVTLIDRAHEQWVFGVGALVMVIIILGASFTSAFYERDGGSMSEPDTAIAVTIFVVGTAGLGGLLFIATQSFTLLACMLFLPAAGAVAAAIVGQWQRDDYTLILPGGIGCQPPGPSSEKGSSGSGSDGDDKDGKDPEAGKKGSDGKDGEGEGDVRGEGAGAAAAGSGDGGSGKPSPKLKVQTMSPAEFKALVGGIFVGNRGRNTAMLIGAFCLPLLLVFFALTLNAGFSQNSSILGWFCMAELLALFFTYLPVREWFGTLEFSIFIPIAGSLALVAHVLGHAFLIAAFDNTNLLTDYFNDEGSRSGRSPRRDDAVLAGVFSLCLYPAIVFTAVGLYKWSDDRWKGSTFVYSCLGISQMIILGFVLAGIFVYDQVGITVGVLVAYLFFAGIVSLIVYAKVHRGYIPPLIVNIAAGSLSLIVLLGLILAIVRVAESFAEDDRETSDALYFQGIGFFSISYWLLAGTLMGFGLLEVFRGGMIGLDETDGEDAVGGGLGSAELLLVAAANVPRPLVPSRGLLPIFALDTTGGSTVEESNFGVLAVCTAAILAVAFGLLASAITSPPYVGLIISTTAQVLLLIFILSTLRNAGNILSRAVAVIIDDAEHQDKEEGGDEELEAARLLADSAECKDVPPRLAASLVRAADRWISGFDASADGRKNDFDGGGGSSSAKSSGGGSGAGAGGDVSAGVEDDHSSLSAAVERVGSFLIRGSSTVRIAHEALLTAMATAEQSHKRPAFVDGVQAVMGQENKSSLPEEPTKEAEGKIITAIRSLARSVIAAGAIGVTRFPDESSIAMTYGAGAAGRPSSAGARASRISVGQAGQGDGAGAGAAGHGGSIVMDNPLASRRGSKGGNSSSSDGETGVSVDQGVAKCGAVFGMNESTGFPSNYIEAAEKILASTDAELLSLHAAASSSSTASPLSTSTEEQTVRASERALAVLTAVHHSADLGEIAAAELYTEESRVFAGVRIAAVSAGAAAAEGLARRWQQFLAWADRIATFIEDLEGIRVVPRAKAESGGRGIREAEHEEGEKTVNPFEEEAKALLEGGTSTRAQVDTLLELRRLRYWARNASSTAAPPAKRSDSMSAADWKAVQDAQRRLAGLGPTIERALASLDELTNFWTKSIGRRLAKARAKCVHKLQMSRFAMLRSMREAEKRRREKDEAEERRRVEQRLREIEEERRAKAEAERKAKEAEEKRIRDEAERIRREQQKKKEEEERRKREEEEERARLEAEERRRMEEARERERREAEEKAREEAERRRREIAELEERAKRAKAEERQRLEEEKRRKEEEERKAAEAERKRRREEEEARKRHEREEEERKRIAAAKKKRDEERRKREAEEARRKIEEEIRRKEKKEKERKEKEGGGGGKGGGDDEARLREVARMGPWDEGFHVAHMELGRKLARAKLSAGTFVDREFTAENYNDGSKEEGKECKWKWERFFDKVKGAKLLADGSTAGDIVQGQLGDCWFCSALAMVADRGDVSRHLLVTGDEEAKKGLVVVRFCWNREWQFVFIDDSLPFAWHGPALMHSADKVEAWPAMIEKGYAKLFGGYQILSGGQPHHAFRDLVGTASESWNIADRIKATSSRAVFDALVEASDAKAYIACASASGSDRFTNSAGIVQGHAFTLLLARRVSDGRGKTLDMVKVRNPHGRTEWNGKYSDEDIGSWTKRLRTEMDHDPRKSGDDGAWCMTFADFAANFKVIYIAYPIHPRPTSGFGGAAAGGGGGGGGGESLDYVYTARFKWTPGSTAGGPPNRPGCEKNVQFMVQPSRRCRLRIALSLCADAKKYRSGGKTAAICCTLAKKGGKRLKHLYVGDSVLQTSYAYSDEVTAAADIDPAEKGYYTLFPYTDVTDKHLEFFVQVITDHPLDKDYVEGTRLQQIPTSIPSA